MIRRPSVRGPCAAAPFRRVANSSSNNGSVGGGAWGPAASLTAATSGHGGGEGALVILGARVSPGTAFSSASVAARHDRRVVSPGPSPSGSSEQRLALTAGAAAFAGPSPAAATTATATLRPRQLSPLFDDPRRATGFQQVQPQQQQRLTLVPSNELAREGDFPGTDKEAAGAESVENFGSGHRAVAAAGSTTLEAVGGRRHGRHDRSGSNGGSGAGLATGGGGGGGAAVAASAALLGGFAALGLCLVSPRERAAAPRYVR